MLFCVVVHAHEFLAKSLTNPQVSGISIWSTGRHHRQTKMTKISLGDQREKLDKPLF